MTTLSTVPELLAQRLAAAPSTPAVTTVDHGDGDRVELSAAALTNWVAKTGNFLDAELELGPGDEVALVADLTWQAWVAALACWSVGAAVHPLEPAAYEDDPDAAAGAALVVVAERWAQVPTDAARLVLGAGMGGRALEALPDGAIDFGAEVLAEPDELLAAPPSGTEVALRLGARQWRLEELCALAARSVDLLGDRLAVAAPLTSLEGLALGLLAPLAAGGQAVGIARLDADRWWPTMAQERATVALVPLAEAVRLPEPEEAHDLTRMVVTGREADAALGGLAARLGLRVERLPTG